MEMKSLPHEEKRLQSLVQRYAGVPSWISAPCMALESARQVAAQIQQAAVQTCDFPSIVRSGIGLTFVLLFALGCFAGDPGFVITHSAAPGFVITERANPACDCRVCDCGSVCRCGDASVLKHTGAATSGRDEKSSEKRLLPVVAPTYQVAGSCPGGVCFSRPQPAAKSRTGVQAVQGCASCGQASGRRGLFGRRR